MDPSVLWVSTVTVVEVIAILFAGLAAGTLNAVVGSGTLVTFPILISFGFSPVTAVISNAVGLVPGSFTGTWGYRSELTGQLRRILQLAPASLLGAVTGSWLLLRLPAETFKFVVPVLLALALIVVLVQPYIQGVLVRRRQRIDSARAGRDQVTTTIVFTYLIGCYGGYFAAAQGILLMGMLGSLLPESLQRLNALKNLLALVVNSVAAMMYIFVAFERISWEAAGLIAVGSMLGGLVGASLGRLLPEWVLRSFIVAIGMFGLWRIISG